MTSDSIRRPEHRYGYTNAFNGLVNLIKEEGVRSLSRGLGTNLVRPFGRTGCYRLTYDPD